MKIEVMTAPHEIEFQDIPEPPVSSGYVKLKMMKIGICGSDIHVYHGKHPFTKYPVTQGHEVSAKIVEIGENVTGFHVGQKVTVEPQVVCGECYPCRHGKYNLCEHLKVMGFQTTGLASEYACVEAEKITPLPDSMTYAQGAMIEPLAVTVHAVHRAGDINGAKILVLGAGPIGILLAQSLKALGAESVMITDVSDFRLGIARECGADYTVNTREKDLNQAILDAFGSDKADFIYDCAGNDITINQAISCARKGSMIILVAVFADMSRCDLAVLNDHELDLNTTMMYRHEDYVEAISLVEQGKVKLEPLMSKHFPFEEYLSAYQYIDEHRETTMKVLIDIDDTEE